MLKFEYLKKLDESLDKIIDDEFEEQSLENNVKCNYVPLYIVAKENGEIVGALTGYTCYDEVYIEELIVLKKHRGKGIGIKLMEEVENHFKNKGLNNINLVTNGFQAIDFYKKCGFKLEFVRKNKSNLKLDKYFFVKFFKE